MNLKWIAVICLLLTVVLAAACQGNQDASSSQRFVAGEATATLMDVLRSRQSSRRVSTQSYASIPCTYYYYAAFFTEEYQGDGVWIVKYDSEEETAEWHVYEAKPIVLTKSAKNGC